MSENEVTKQFVPIDGKDAEHTLLALCVMSSKGRDAVTVHAMSRRSVDQSWQTTSGINIPAQHAVWEALLGAYERTVSP